MDRSYGQDGVVVRPVFPHSARCRSGDPGVEHLSCDASKATDSQVGQHASGLRRCPGPRELPGIRRAKSSLPSSPCSPNTCSAREDRDLYHSASPSRKARECTAAAVRSESSV